MSFDIVKVFDEKVRDNANPIPVAAIMAMAECVEHMQPTTAHELISELDAAKEKLYSSKKELSKLNSSIGLISLRSGCDIYIKNITRALVDQSFQECLKSIRERSKHFTELSQMSRAIISKNANQFIHGEMSILIHGNSRVVKEIILANQKNCRLSVYVTVCGLERDGVSVANELHQNGFHTTLIPDCGVGYHMHKMDLVLMGAEAVMETGGVLNKLGSLQVGMLAKANNVPVYIACESYKFTRMYPLSQKDVPNTKEDQALTNMYRPKELLEGIDYASSKCDYLPPESITLLITDLGVLAPSSVSDELIKLYQ